MNREETIEKMLSNPPLGPDGKFRFWCTACGKCCCNSEGVILSSDDIFRAAKFLGITTSGFIKQYCDGYIGPQSHLPLLTVKTEGKNNRCVFLDNRNKCSIHQAKPGVCETFPLGRTVSLDGQSEVEYRMSPLHCGKRCKEFTVREWLSGTGFEKSSEYFKIWHVNTGSITSLLNPMCEMFGDAVLRLTTPGIEWFLYHNYDTEKEFLPQFEENCKTIIDLLEGRKAAAGKKEFGEAYDAIAAMLEKMA